MTFVCWLLLFVCCCVSLFVCCCLFAVYYSLFVVCCLFVCTCSVSPCRFVTDKSTDTKPRVNKKRAGRRPALSNRKTCSRLVWPVDFGHQLSVCCFACARSEPAYGRLFFVNAGIGVRGLVRSDQSGLSPSRLQTSVISLI